MAAQGFVCRVYEPPLLFGGACAVCGHPKSAHAAVADAGPTAADEARIAAATLRKYRGRTAPTSPQDGHHLRNHKQTHRRREELHRGSSRLYSTAPLPEDRGRHTITGGASRSLRGSLPARGYTERYHDREAPRQSRHGTTNRTRTTKATRSNGGGSVTVRVDFDQDTAAVGGRSRPSGRHHSHSLGRSNHHRSGHSNGHATRRRAHTTQLTRRRPEDGERFVATRFSDQPAAVYSYSLRGTYDDNDSATDSFRTADSGLSDALRAEAEAEVEEAYFTSLREERLTALTARLETIELAEGSGPDTPAEKRLAEDQRLVAIAGWDELVCRQVQDLFRKYVEDSPEMKEHMFAECFGELGLRGETGSYFRAFDRDGHGTWISSQDFLMGVIALDPRTPNSGEWRAERALYVHRFYHSYKDGLPWGQVLSDIDRCSNPPRCHPRHRRSFHTPSEVKRFKAMGSSAEEFVSVVMSSELRGTSSLFRWNVLDRARGLGDLHIYTPRPEYVN